MGMTDEYAPASGKGVLPDDRSDVPESTTLCETRVYRHGVRCLLGRGHEGDHEFAADETPATAILDRFDLVRWRYRDEFGNLYSMDLPEVRALHDLICELEAARAARERGGT